MRLHSASATSDDDDAVYRLALCSAINAADERVGAVVLQTILWAPADARWETWLAARLSRSELKALAISAVLVVNRVVLCQAWEAALREMARQRAVRHESFVRTLRRSERVLRPMQDDIASA